MSSSCSSRPADSRSVRRGGNKTTRKKPHFGPLERRRLFDACSRRELEMVARSCMQVTREAGTVFARDGQTSREFVLVVSGSVAVIRQGFPEVILGSDEWFGDIELLSDGASSATVIALTDVECIVMSRPEFACLFDAVPSFRKRLVRSVASIARLRSEGGGSQILMQDPGDRVELFQPAS